MKDLKELGLNPIDDGQAKEVNGGSVDKELIWCCVNIPPVSLSISEVIVP